MEGVAYQVHRRHGRAPLPQQDGPGPLLDGGVGDGRVEETVHPCHERLQGPAVLRDHVRGGEDHGVGVLSVREKLKEENIRAHSKQERKGGRNSHLEFEVPEPPGGLHLAVGVVGEHHPALQHPAPRGAHPADLGPVVCGVVGGGGLPGPRAVPVDAAGGRKGNIIAGERTGKARKGQWAKKEICLLAWLK